VFILGQPSSRSIAFLARYRLKASMDGIANLAAFLKVIEKGSLTGAAIALNCTTSTISKRIKQLEYTTGATLLHRSTHGNAYPTEAGTTYFEHVRTIMQDLEVAKRAVQDVIGTVEGRLKVHLTPGTGQTIVLPSIINFIKHHPQLEIELSIQPEDYDILGKGFDITISSKGADSEDIGYTSIDARELTEAHYMILASQEYLDRHGTPQEPEELIGYNCLISNRQPSPHQWWFRRGFKKFAVNVRGSFESDNWLSVYEAAKAGLGIVRMLRLHGDDNLRDDMVSLFSDKIVSQRSIWALTPRMDPTPKKIDTFLKFVTADIRTRSAASRLLIS
jgi:DNA-binding transcriptional LysR family regulator